MTASQGTADGGITNEELLERLPELIRYFELLARWLSERGATTEASMINAAARDLAAARCWWLSAEIRAKRDRIATLMGQARDAESEWTPRSSSSAGPSALSVSRLSLRWAIHTSGPGCSIR